MLISVVVSMRIVQIYYFLVAFVLKLNFATSKVFIDVRAQDCYLKTPDAVILEESQRSSPGQNVAFFAHPQCPDGYDMVQTRKITNIADTIII